MKISIIFLVTCGIFFTASARSLDSGTSPDLFTAVNVGAGDPDITILSEVTVVSGDITATKLDSNLFSMQPNSDMASGSVTLYYQAVYPDGRTTGCAVLVYDAFHKAWPVVNVLKCYGSMTFTGIHSW